jgi:hypothetical protein
MTARKFVPAIPASQSRTDAGPYLNPFPRTEDDASLATMAPLFAALDLDARVAALMHRWHPDRVAEERDAAEIDAAEDAREIAATERQAQDDADELAGARDAASWYPTYR